MGVSRKYQNGKAGPPAVHTPSISNVVGGVGGWSTGSGSTMFSYMSYQTTTSFVATLGQDFSSDTRARILCSAVGAFMIDILKHFDWHWGYSNTYYAYQSYETLPGGYSLRFGLATNCAARCTELALYYLSDDYLNHKQYIHDQTPWLEYGSGTSDYLCLKVHPYVEEVDTGGTCSDQRGSPTIIPH